jgi:hypothetical protein
LRFCSSCVESGGDLSRYPFVTTNAWYHDRIAGWKATNPSLKALVYKDMSSTRSYHTGPTPPAGIDWTWANQNHPDWFTLDGSGNRIEWAGFGGHWQMDIGNRAYQDQWAANVIAELRAKGWSGVWVDNANMDPSGYFSGKTSQEYPTQASYQAATRSFLANVGPKVIAAGFLFIPNIQAHGSLAQPSLWADWVQFTSGASREYWTKWGTGTDMHLGDSGWAGNQAVFAAVQDAGKIFLPITYAPKTDTRSIRYARASFLLKWNGGPSAFMFRPAPEAQDSWTTEWTGDIGLPSGSATQVGVGWKRSYTRGTVYVNPSSSQSVTIDGRALGPTTGLVRPR